MKKLSKGQVEVMEMRVAVKHKKKLRVAELSQKPSTGEQEHLMHPSLHTTLSP